MTEWAEGGLLWAHVRTGWENGAVVTAAALLLCAALILIAARRTRRRRDRRLVELRTRLRDAELQLEANRAEVEAARLAQTRFAEGDPAMFGRGGAAAVAEEGPAARRIAPAAWVDPLRPALAQAYLGMARDILAGAESEADLDRARMMAYGAVAAAPERDDCAGVRDRIEEAGRLRLFSELTEAETLAWKIVRLHSLQQGGPDGAVLTARSDGRIGHALHLSGWESEELRDAALGELGERAEDAVTAGARAWRGGAGMVFRTRRRRRRAQAADASGARVVALGAGRNAAAGVAMSRVEIEEIALRGASAGAAAAYPVLVLRNPSRPDQATEPPEPPSQTPESGSDRERELRRLWQRRRRPDMLGETHPRTLAARANIGHEAGRLGRSAEAEGIFREVLAAMRAHPDLGERHDDTLTVRHNLAVELWRQERFDDAEAEFTMLLGALGAESAKDDPLALAAAHGLAEVWAGRGDFEEAETGFRAVWRSRCTLDRFGPDHPHALWSRLRMLRAGEAAACAPA